MKTTKTLDILIKDIQALFLIHNNWNSGEFKKLVDEYLLMVDINPKKLHSILEDAFSMYMITNMKSVDCISSTLTRNRAKLGL